MSLPFIAFSEPVKAQKYKYHDKEWTLWDRFDIQGDLTLSNFIKYFKDTHSLEVTMLSCGQTMLYSFFMPPKKLAERQNMKITKILQMISNKPIADHLCSLVLEMCVNDRDGEDVEVPSVCLHLE